MLNFEISKSNSLNIPGLKRAQSLLNRIRQKNYGAEDLRKFYQSQKLTIETIESVAKILRPGMSEVDAASFLEESFHSLGVKKFLHRPFAWFGKRTTFFDMQTYADTLPRENVLLKENDCFILDAAPYINKYPSDVGLGFSIGSETDDIKYVNQCIEEIEEEVISIFRNSKNTKEVYQYMNHLLEEKKLDNIHSKYPFGVLAHRLHPNSFQSLPSFLKPFSLQAYLDILSRGFLEETIRGESNVSMSGVWAIEPHIGYNDYGTKFEKILVVQDDEIYWLHKKFENVNS